MTESDFAVLPLSARRQERARELEQLLDSTVEPGAPVARRRGPARRPGAARPGGARPASRPHPPERRSADRCRPRASPRSASRHAVELELALRQSALRRPRAGGDGGRDARRRAQRLDVHLQGRRGADPRRARAPAAHGDEGRLRRRRGSAGSEGCFTAGGSSANLVALLLAQKRRGAGVAGPRDWAARRLVVYTSAEGHYSISKNAGIVGIGRHNVRMVPTDDAGRMDVGALAAAPRRRPRPGAPADADQRHRRHHGARRVRSDSRHRRGSSRSTASGCTSTARWAAASCSAPRGATSSTASSSPTPSPGTRTR